MSALFPERAAGRAVGRAYVEAARADPTAVNRLAAAELAPGGPAVVMDVLGQPGRNLARSAANLSGEARDVLEGTLDPRLAAQGQRFSDWFRQWLNHPDAFAAQEAIDAAQHAGNSANYRAAMRQGDVALWSPELERLTGAPAVQRALRDAVDTAKERAIA